MRLITILYYWIRYYLFYGHWDFHKAAYDGDLKTLKDLLKYLKIDPSRKNNIAIRDASYNGHLEVVKELLKDPRVDPRVNWEHVSIEHKKLLIKEEKDKLRKDLTFSYLLISKISPQINIENKIVKSAILTIFHKMIFL